MRRIEVETVNGNVYENVSEINDLYLLQYIFDKKQTKKFIKDVGSVYYYELAAAFDIETTNIYQKDEEGNIKSDPRPFAFMYHWQFCIEDQVCFGRTWEDFQRLIARLEKCLNLSIKNRLVIYVHNLSYEWQF